MENLLVQLIQGASIGDVFKLVIVSILLMWVRSVKKEFSDVKEFIPIAREIKEILPLIKDIKDILPEIKDMLIKQAVHFNEIQHIRDRQEKYDRDLNDLKRDCMECRKLMLTMKKD